MEEDLKCLICSHEYDDSLVLGCSHSLCLICAHELLKRDEKYYENKYIKCDICQKLTSIEEQTLKEINNFAYENQKNSFSEQGRSQYLQNRSFSGENKDTLDKKQDNHHYYNNGLRQQNMTASRSSSNLHDFRQEQPPMTHTFSHLHSGGLGLGKTSVLQNAYNSGYNTGMGMPLSHNNSFVGGGNTRLLNITNNVNATKNICAYHNEEAGYFCFTCFKKCVCSECVIHGEHKNHEVLNAKQAYPVIIEKTNDLMNEVSNKILDIKTVQNSIEKSKYEIMSFTDKIKQEMTSAFAEVRKRLDNKEKELNEKADKYLEDTMQEFNTYSRLIQAKIISLNKMIDSVNSNLLRKDEINYINFFADNRKKLENLIDEEFESFPDLSGFKTIKVNINMESLNNMIHSLGGLHLEVSMLKGFDLNKKVKTMRMNEIAGIRDILQNNNTTTSQFPSSPPLNNTVSYGIRKSSHSQNNLSAFHERVNNTLSPYPKDSHRDPQSPYKNLMN